VQQYDSLSILSAILYDNSKSGLMTIAFMPYPGECYNTRKADYNS